MIRRPPRSTQSRSSAASDVYKRQELERLRSSGFALIGTSRYGSTQYGLLKELAERPLAVVIGGPRTGLLQYVRRTDFDLVINTVPGQGTETVRSEEALFSTLALINSVL